MQDPFLKLEENAKGLGKHNLKYIYTILKYKDKLISALERNYSLDKIHLWNVSRDFSHEMDTISDTCNTLEEKLDFLGCYYAIQFLTMNLKSIDALGMELATSKESQRNGIYREFMMRAGKKFRALTGSYMQKLLNLFMEGEEIPEFVICSVGARADQDDIDICIITREAQVSKSFGIAISKLNKQMLIHSTRLHFHMAEMMGLDRYYFTIREYWNYLRTHTYDFVFITEITGAARIFGSEELFDDFKRKIINKYFYRPGGNNKYHEAYIRGLLGEVHALLLRKPSKDNLNPKLDSIRMLKGFVYVLKSIHGIEEVNAWDILEKLKELEPDMKDIYTRFQDALSSVEMFRYIYQLFVVQEEDIVLNEAYAFDNMDRIANVLGYEKNGTIRPWHYIVHDYHEQVKRTHEIAEVLVDKLAAHLRSITVFSELIEEVKTQKTVELNPFLLKKRLNLAMEFPLRGRFFKGNTFWDDLLDELLEPDKKLLRRFITDFNLLSGWRKEVILNSYITLGEYSIYPLFIIFRVLFENGKDTGGHGLFLAFNRVFMERLPSFSDIANKFLGLFEEKSSLINDYLMVINPEEVKLIEEIIAGGTICEVKADLLNIFRKLCMLHYSTSNYFKGFFHSVFKKYPECIKFLNSPEKLKDINMGILGEIEDLESLKERKIKLGAYYDFEFVRVALLTLNGLPISKINAEFTEFSDIYIRTLFNICKEEIEEQEGHKIITDDHMAIYETGGHAREQAYVDDFDVIVILNSDDGEIKKLLTRIVMKMNSEITRRGMLPHYRFIEHFGNYVTMISEIEEFFALKTSDDFIDKSQIIGSRLLIGSSKIDKEYEDKIIRPYIFEQSDDYIALMLKDMKGRHIAQILSGRDTINIKECRGGLRDIESFLFIAKAKFNIRETIGERLFVIISEIDNSRYKHNIEILKEYFYFIKSLRDLYRLTVTADDEISEEALNYVIKFWKSGNMTAGELFNKIKIITVETYGIICDLLRDFNICQALYRYSDCEK